MNEIKKLIAKFAFFFVLVSFFMVSCGDNSEEQIEDEIQDTVVTIVDRAENLVYPLPTPLEVADMLNKAGASYILDFSNSPENVDKYFLESSKALNLGVYGADLSYTATYNKSQETRDFFVCTKKLQDAMDIHTPQSANISERIESNIDNPDSLYNILTSSFKQTFEFLNDNNKGAVSVLVLAGGWIEGLYISTEIASLNKNNAEILQGIADQKISLEKLVKLMETYKEDQYVGDVLSKLNKVSEAFSDLKEVEGKYQMTDESFAKIQKEVSALRKSIVDTP